MKIRIIRNIIVDFTTPKATTQVEGECIWFFFYFYFSIGGKWRFIVGFWVCVPNCGSGNEECSVLVLGPDGRRQGRLYVRVWWWSSSVSLGRALFLRAFFRLRGGFWNWYSEGMRIWGFMDHWMGQEVHSWVLGELEIFVMFFEVRPSRWCLSPDGKWRHEWGSLQLRRRQMGGDRWSCLCDVIDMLVERKVLLEN